MKSELSETQNESEQPIEARPTEANASDVLMQTMVVGILALTAGYLARSSLLKLAGNFYEANPIGSSPLHDLAGWFYLQTEHSYIAIFSFAVVVAVAYAVFRGIGVRAAHSSENA